MKMMRFIGDSSESMDDAAADAVARVNEWISKHPIYTDDGRSAYTMTFHTHFTPGPYRNEDRYYFWIFLMDPMQ